MELQQKRFHLLLFFSTPAVLDFMFKVASSEDILFREGLPRFHPFLYSRILARPLSHRIIPHALSTSSPTDFSRKAALLDIPCTSPLLHGWNHDNHFYPNYIAFDVFDCVALQNNVITKRSFNSVFGCTTISNEQLESMTYSTSVMIKR